MTLPEVVDKYVLGMFLIDDLPQIAIDLVKKGYESPSLRELAGLQVDDSEVIRNLFLMSLEELGMKVPSITEAGLSTARRIANDILIGSVTPYEGAKNIWEDIYTKYPDLTRLKPFVGMASEYEDDEEHRKEYIEDIVKEAKKFVQEFDGYIRS